MNKFLKFIFINYISVIILGLLLLTSSLFITTRIKSDELYIAYQNERNGYGWVKNVKNISGFILGSSTLKYGISSTLLSNQDSNWVNFSKDARDPIEMFYLLENYSKIIKPKEVIIGLDPWIYAKKYYTFRNKIMYLDLNGKQLLNFERNDYLAFFHKIKYVLLTTFYTIDKKKDSLHNFKIPPDLGSSFINKTPLNFKDVYKDNFDISKTGWSNLQFEYLKRIKLFCVKNNIRMIFIIPPKRNDLTATSKTIYLKENTEWWKQINEIIANENIISTYGLFKNKKQDLVFADAIHLNKNGQIIFSNYVKSKIKYPFTASLNYKWLE